MKIQELADRTDTPASILERTTLATLAERSGGRFTTPVPVEVGPRSQA